MKSSLIFVKPKNDINTIFEKFTSALSIPEKIPEAILMFNTLCCCFSDDEVLLKLNTIRDLRAANGYSLAHFLSVVNAKEITAALNLTRREVLRKDNEGNSPLHIAVKKTNIEMAALILKIDGVGLTLMQVNNEGYTPLTYTLKEELNYDKILLLFLPQMETHLITSIANKALENKQYQFIDVLMTLTKGLRIPLNMQWIELALQLKDSAPNLFGFFKRWKKEDSITHGKLIKDEPAPGENPADMIIKRSFFDGSYSDKEALLKESQFKQQLYDFTNDEKSPLVAPLLYIIALAAINKHTGPLYTPNKPPKKPLKVMFTHHKNLIRDRDIVNEKTVGLYTHKSTLYVAVGNESIEYINQRLDAFYHEATHMVIAEVMQNQGEPYPANREDLKLLFIESMTELKNQLPDIKAKTEHQASVISIFEANFMNYTPENWSSELLVRVPQTLAILGYDEGYKWLKENTTKLLAYYEDHFLPACFSYLINHNASTHLQLSDHFKIKLELIHQDLKGQNDNKVTL